MNWRDALDRFLDWTIFFSYNRIGYVLRNNLIWDASDLALSLVGKVVLVTGANAGLGFATALGLAQRGATVYLVCRNAAKGEQARAEIAAATRNPNIHLAVVDLSSLESVRGFVTQFSQTESRLDILINNAGVLLPKREVSVDGIELTFATNVLGGFLLTQQLLPLLRQSTPARIIHVSSGGMYARKLNVDDLQFERESYNGPLAYAQSKRAQVILNEHWAEHLAGSGVTSNCMHPGWADTPGLQSSLPGFRNLVQWTLRSSAEGADTILWLAVTNRVAGRSGKFWFDRRARPTHRMAATRETQADRLRLWQACTALSNS